MNDDERKINEVLNNIVKYSEGLKVIEALNTIKKYCESKDSNCTGCVIYDWCLSYLNDPLMPEKWKHIPEDPALNKPNGKCSHNYTCSDCPYEDTYQCESVKREEAGESEDESGELPGEYKQHIMNRFEEVK